MCGAIDTNFEKCMQAIDCKMNREMKSATDFFHSGHPMALFAQQMCVPPLSFHLSFTDASFYTAPCRIPHHVNAVNMAKILLQTEAAANIENAMEEDGLVHILWGAARTIHVPQCTHRKLPRDQHTVISILK